MTLRAPKFTQEMRDAIVTACLDQGLSPRKARDAAERGELEGVPAFSMSEAYARDLRDNAVEDRAVIQFQDIQDVAKQACEMAATMALERLTYLRRGQSRRRDKSLADWEEVRKLVLIASHGRAEKASQRNGATSTPTEPVDNTAEQERKQLERRLSKQAAPSSTDTPKQAGTAGQAVPQGNGHSTAAQQQQGDGAEAGL